MVDKGLLRELGEKLGSSCSEAVQSTCPSSSSTQEQQQYQWQQPQETIWLKSCSNLLGGPLLAISLLQQQQQRHQEEEEKQWKGAGGNAEALHARSSRSMVMVVLQWQQQVLQQLQLLLGQARSSSCYEVQAALLQATALHLQQALLQLHLLSLSSSSNSTRSSSSGIVVGSKEVAGVVEGIRRELWGWLQGKQNVKVKKRLLKATTLLQELEPLLGPGGAAAGVAVAGAAVASASAVAAGGTGEKSKLGMGLALKEQQQEQQQQQEGQLLQQVDQAVAVLSGAKEQESKAYALQCWAQTLQPLLAAACTQGGPWSAELQGSTSSSSSKKLLELVGQFLKAVDCYSQPWQAELMRGAAAAALDTSGILLLLRPQPVGSSSSGSSWVSAVACAGCSLRAWRLLLQLMEDEDDSVRQGAADVGQACMMLLGAHQQQGKQLEQQQGNGQHSEQKRGSLGELDPPTAIGAAVEGGGVGLGDPALQRQYVEAVERSTFQLFSSCTSWWPELNDDVLLLLADLVVDSATAATAPAALRYKKGFRRKQREQEQQVVDLAAPAGGSGGPSGVALGSLTVRRLFDKEADNHHIEVVLSAQLAAKELKQLLLLRQQEQQQGDDNKQQQKEKGGLPLCLAPWLQQVRERLVDTIGRLKNPPAHSGWIGGVTNHPEVFVPLYRCLLGVWVMASSAAPGDAGSDTAAFGRGSSSSAAGGQEGDAAGVTGATGRGLALMEVEGSVGVAVRQLKQLQPALLLWPVLEELQELLQSAGPSLVGRGAAGELPAGGTEAGIAGGWNGDALWGKRVLFLLREYQQL